MEREGEEHILETEGQVICNGGSIEMSKPEITGTLEEGGDRDNWGGEFGETKAEADGVGKRECLDRALATILSGPGTGPRSW